MSPEPLAVLLGAIRALISNNGAAPVLLPTYDSAGDQLIRDFHAAGFSAEDLMALERNLARLRELLEAEEPLSRDRPR
jgi:hypothetical protein